MTWRPRWTFCWPPIAPRDDRKRRLIPARLSSRLNSALASAPGEGLLDPVTKTFKVVWFWDDLFDVAELFGFLRGSIVVDGGLNPRKSGADLKTGTALTSAVVVGSRGPWRWSARASKHWSMISNSLAP